MYFLGCLSFFQIVFLPGFLFVNISRIKTNTLSEKIIAIFTFSLIINYLLVFFLTLIGLYQSTFIYIIFLLEIIICFLILVKKKNFYRQIDLSYIFFFVIAARFLLLFFQNLSLKSVFLTGDVIDSWNVWAKAWLENKIPSATYHYPQLIPANWSLTYIFMRNSAIEYFAKLLMPLFIIGILLIFFDLVSQTKKITYIFGLIIAGGLLHYYFDSSFLRDGYPDIAFAFFAFLPFYCFLLFQKHKKEEYLLLMIIFALGSFLTKQLGIYLVLLAIIQPLRLIFKHGNNLKVLKKYRFLLFFLYFLATTTFSWYLLKMAEIKTAYNIEGIYRLAMTGKLNQFTLEARLDQSLKLLAPNIKGVLIVVVIAVLVLSSLRQKTAREIFFFVVLPYFIVWTLFLNYDQRNLTVIFPYLGYLGGQGMSKIINFDESIHWKLIRIPVFFVSPTAIFVLIFALFVFSNFFISNQLLIKQQTEGKKQIGIPKLNSRLYEFYYKNGFQGKIATSYYRLCHLPEIGKFCLCQKKYNKETVQNSQTKYLLFPENELQPINKSLKKAFVENGWIFIIR